MTAHTLFDLVARPSAMADPVAPWEPGPVSRDQWPPDYRGALVWRMQMLQRLRNDPELLQASKVYYSTRPAEFIIDWCDTYDPRRNSSKWIPFVFFEKQAEFIAFLESLRNEQQSGLIEKCRDVGATWGCCAYSVWAWLFVPEIAIGWGSRKETLVDKLGDPDSIFEKMRLLINRMPDVFLPVGFAPKDHSTFMKLINPQNGATITGEAGDNIGRGGRKTCYFKDEAQPLNSKVLTPFGWREIGSLHIGDLVCGPNSDLRQVIGINDCGEHEVYRFTFSDGTSVECSENHLWNVNCVIGKRVNRTLRAHEIVKSYRYVSPSGQKKYAYRLPMIKAAQFVPSGKFPLDPYVAGALLGDGSINSGVVSFTSADMEIVEQIATHLPDGCRVTHGGGYAWRIVDVRGRMGNKPEARSRARQAVINAGIGGKLAHEKFIPHDYKFASTADRLAILQGLMDTDGSASGGVATFHSCSEQLADDVRFIVQSLGGIATKVVKPDHRGYRDMYVLNVILDMPVFRLSRKLAQMKPRKQSIEKSIVKVEAIGKKIVRCISVDKNDGLYITDGCAVTHNSAHYERPEKIEAALGDNTNTQIDISSVNGVGNVFHRRREAGEIWQPGRAINPGVTRVFIFDWRDHPEKTEEWYKNRRAKYEREGMLHLFAQEVDRSYSASVQNTIIPAEWIDSIVDAHLRIKWRDVFGNVQTGIPDSVLGDVWAAGLDVADEGLDKNAFTLRQSIIWRHSDVWGKRDTGETTRRVAGHLKAQGKRLAVQYDCIGVGAGVKSEYNRLVSEKLLDPEKIQFIPWNAGAGVLNPYFHLIEDDEESPLNGDFFENLKAQAWWSFRTRCYKTHKNITEGEIYPIEEMVSIDGKMPFLHQIKKELAQPVMKKSKRLKTMIDKKPEGVASPNIADAGIMMYFPLDPSQGAAMSGNYGV